MNKPNQGWWPQGGRWLEMKGIGWRAVFLKETSLWGWLLLQEDKLWFGVVDEWFQMDWEVFIEGIEICGWLICFLEFLEESS